MTTFTAWQEGHRAALATALARLLRRSLGTLLTASVIGIALALPLCLWLLLIQASRLAGSLHESREIAVFLTLETSALEAKDFAARWRQDSRVDQVTLRSPRVGLAEMRVLDGLEAALAALDANPLPWVALIAPAPSTDDRALAVELGRLPSIDFVQHDAQWRDRLSSWLGLGRRFAGVAAGLLGLGVLLVVGNTVRLDIHGQAEDIATLRLLGAGNAYIRRPFLYMGAIYGGLGGLIALGLAIAAGASLAPAVDALIASYGNVLGLVGWSPMPIAVLALGSIGLGLCGAWLVVGQYLRQQESAP